MRYLITQSLLSAWNYVHTCFPGCEEDAMASFLHTLRKEPDDITAEQLEKIQKGIAFESAVYATAIGRARDQRPEWERGIEEVASLVKGAQFQVKVQRPLHLNGMDFLVYGILDALQAGVISDIKFKNKSFGSLDLAGEYFGSPQHPVYFYLVPEAHLFRYLVSDGTDIYIEQYTPDETVRLESLLTDFMEFLRSAGLMEIYQQHWQALS